MNKNYLRSIGLLLGLAGTHSILISACGDKQGALERPTEQSGDMGQAGSGGRKAPSGEDTAGSPSENSTGGAESSAGTGGSEASSGAAGDSGAPAVVDTSAGAGDMAGSGGSSSAGVSGEGGEPSVEEPADPDPACVFHTLPMVREAGAAGAGPDDGSAGAAGAPPEVPSLLLGDDPFVGPHLTDGEGYSLYIYGADFPGDCENEPISTCYDDCALAWPVFEAGERLLGEGLDDSTFGTIERDDGLYQTTYLGWPLYYYKRDAEPEMLVGQGKGSIWLAAEIVLPNVLIMRAPQEADGVKYLADDKGFTLYSYSGDMPADAADPESRCEGECLTRFSPYLLTSLRPATPLEPADLSLFVREDGLGLQVAYQGVPLYHSLDDERSGEMEGLAQMDWDLVLP